MSSIHMFGYTKKEILGENISLLISEKQRKPFLNTLANKIKQIQQQKKIVINNIIALHKNEYTFPVKLTISKQQDSQVNYFYVYIEDLTVFENIKEALRVSMENYQALAENASEVIIQVDRNFNILYINSAATRIFGYEFNELSGKHFKYLFPEGGFEQHKISFLTYNTETQSNTESEYIKMEIPGKKKSGNLFPMEISFGKWIGSHDKKSLTCIISDITRRKETEKKLRHIAYHDKLTSLGNRDLFEIFFNEILNDYKKGNNGLAALLYLDLDGFKKVNDTLGHNFGDKILVECANRINYCLRINDSIYKFHDVLDINRFTDLYRFGGDEFVILLPRIKNREDAGIVAQRIINKIKEKFIIKKSSLVPYITLGCSIGIAIFPTDGITILDLVRNADRAMYQAKNAGNTFVYYSKNLESKATQNLVLETKIYTAIQRHEFINYFQPIVDIEGAIVGFESLLRWNDPERGVVMPKDFLPFTEKTGLIVKLGKDGISHACKQIGRINECYGKKMFLTVNISTRQFEQADFVEFITLVLKKTGFDPHNFILEITESYIMKDTALLIEKITHIKKRNPGIRFALDDFGTGYSSLQYISNLPIDIVKIDKSFILHISNDKNKKIVISIIALAKGLEKILIAEGVESKEAFELLGYNECDLFQGFLFSKPLPENNIIDLVKNNKRFIV